MNKEIKFAIIPDADGNSYGDHGYMLYYVADDSEGTWILEDNAGVTCTSYSFTDVYRNQSEELDAEGDRLEAEINNIISNDAGEVASYYTGTGTRGGAGSEAEELMRRWGWIA